MFLLKKAPDTFTIIAYHFVSEILNLFKNTMQGIIPTDLGAIQSLKRLQIGLNSFSGNIPKEIGKLQLTHLTMATNFFNGTIPDSLYTATTLGNYRLYDAVRHRTFFFHI